MKLLYISNIASKRMAYNFTGAAIEAAHFLGYEFIGVANRSNSTPTDIKEDEEKYGIKLLHIDLARSPFSKQNIKAYKQLCNIIRENNIECIHCNTPVGGMLGRLAGKKCGVKKVIYQVHGFHFYKGAPKLNWMLYYPIERWLARYTDSLITINKEDYAFAKKKFRLRNRGKVHYVPGVGIDTKQYIPDENMRIQKRKELGIKDEEFVLVAVGRLEPNKNNETLIRAVAKCRNSNIKLILCGDGEQRKALKDLGSELNIDNQVFFLGNRSDMREIYCAADCLVMASFREGLSRTIMEAMASGLPCIVSRIRGNVDLIEDGKGGYLCEPSNIQAFSSSIRKVCADKAMCTEMGDFNRMKIKEFDISIVEKKLISIYTEV